jgi:hypothetical protein
MWKLSKFRMMRGQGRAWRWISEFPINLFQLRQAFPRLIVAQSDREFHLIKKQ